MPIKLLLDPWSPDYEAPIQTDGPPEATGSGEVDPTVETSDWSSIGPSSTIVSRRICFVDGVRRLEARVMAHGEAGNLIHGLFASCGAGCVVNDERRASYQSVRINRYLLLGAGKQKTARVIAGSQKIEFQGVASPGDSHDDLVNSLQNLMRTSEVAVAESLFGADTCVFADGPLNYFSAATAPLVGVIKRIYLPYLDATHFGLVAELKPRERTPLFSIRDGKYDRYSWYQRLATPRAMEHELSGVVRLEVRAALGLQQACDLANFAAARLPEFASTAVRDPRAPQNLVPVGALEEHLRLRLGDVVTIRRAIERRIFEGVTL